MLENSFDSRLLVNQKDVRSGKPWQSSFYDELYSILVADDGFPCLFSRNAARKGALRFLFVDDISTDGLTHVASGLREYVRLSKAWNGSLNTAYPLLIVFSTEVICDRSLVDYHTFGWKMLQAIHEHDRTPWPQTIPEHPAEAGWSMCFDGMPLFCNMSSPAQGRRRSRNLGRHFVIVVNPRERFDIVAGNSPSGDKVRRSIRDRILAYDGQEHSPLLGTYDAGALEWQQYGLPEGNEPSARRCPFRAFTRRSSD